MEVLVFATIVVGVLIAKAAGSSGKKSTSGYSSYSYDDGRPSGDSTGGGNCGCGCGCSCRR